jgi:hypothetical protein
MLRAVEDEFARLEKERGIGQGGAQARPAPEKRGSRRSRCRGREAGKEVALVTGKISRSQVGGTCLAFPILARSDSIQSSFLSTW